MCEGKPAANVKVKLYDVDSKLIITTIIRHPIPLIPFAAADPDDLMDQAVTNSEGEFELKGHETEVSTIDPKLNIYHVFSY